MRRRVVREVKQQPIDNKINEKKVEQKKEEIKAKVEVKVENKENNKKEIKLPDRKVSDSVAQYICENKLDDYNYMTTTTTYTLADDEKFLNWLFANILDFQEIDYNGGKYTVIDSSRNNFQDVTNCDLKGTLVAGSCIVYNCQKFAFVFVPDQVICGADSSSINITYQSAQVPDTSLLSKHVSWLVLCDASIVAANEGTTLEMLKDYIDQSKPNYGIIEPNNKGSCGNVPVQTFRVTPNRKLAASLPKPKLIPTTQGTSQGNNSMYCTATGYMLFYNKTEQNDEMDSNINLDIIYVRQKVSIAGSEPTQISINNLVSKLTEGVVFMGNCNNVVRIPRNSTFFQNNFGDSNTNTTFSNGTVKIFYPTVYWNIYNLTPLEG